MKLNWGHYIAIAMVSFMLFIMYFVYNTFTQPSHDHHLVSEDYYKDEINYQTEIDAMANAKKLSAAVQLINFDKGIKVVFPKDVDYSTITGTVDFQRASDIKLDFKLPLKLTSNEFIIPNEKLVHGFYNVRVDWSANNIQYLLKDKHNY